MMKDNNAWRLFIIGYLPLLFLGLVLIFCTPKGTLVSHLAMNRLGFLDQIFYYITMLGDGVMVGLVCLLALLVRYKYTLLLISIGIAQLLVCAVLKRKVFGNLPRPRRYFEDVPEEWLVEGVSNLSNYAFPSGHTVTAFGLCFFCALMFDRKGLTLLFLCLATLIGFSRIYLFQHFLEDVVAGSFVGVLVTAICYYFAKKWGGFWDNQSLQQSLSGWQRRYDQAT